MVIGGGHVVERFNRTLKENIQKRLDAMELDRYEWVKLLDPIINTYNNTERRSSCMSPNQARQQGNERMTWFNLWSNAKRDRKYPESSKGDEVRVMIKKKAMTKGYQPKRSVPIYKITGNSGSHYIINDGKRKVYTRHELLNV